MISLIALVIAEVIGLLSTAKTAATLSWVKSRAPKRSTIKVFKTTLYFIKPSSITDYRPNVKKL